MTCPAVLDLVEAIAAEDLIPSGEVRVHLETCPMCAAALATARRIEAALASRPVMQPPARLAAILQQRIRRERWTMEQQVDRVFNLAIAASVILVLAGVAFAIRGSVVLDFVGQLSALVASAGAEAVSTAVPSLTTYVAATGLLVSGLAMWWWAES